MENSLQDAQLAQDAADLFTKENQRRVEQWVQNFVIKHEEGKGQVMVFQNEPIS